ncbi:adenylate/guanylate cyclase domain-containing protein [Bradyrhizobium genosp. P]|uniref:adenylate/guanylate cyclase domain-containing protein n=1 Tax=Bradyrhizobium genosp. P TaxID=83641 RepID=UPI003CE82663
MRVATRILHPLVAAWSATWRAGEPVEQAEFGFEMFGSGQYQGSPGQTIMERNAPLRIRLDGPRLDSEHDLFRELRSIGLIDYYGLPLRSVAGTFGYCAFATSSPEGFVDVDLPGFDDVVDLVCPFVEALNMRKITAVLLDTYVGQWAGARVLGGQIRRGDCDLIRAAFWYSDLRDFTGLNERLTADEVVDLLNCYFDVVDCSIRPRGGEVLQFIGDAILGVFESDGSADGDRTACQNAVDAAVDALAEMERLNLSRKADERSPIRFGVGLHLGSATCGNVGAEKRLSFNVVGSSINLAARLEALSKETPYALIASSTMERAVPGCLISIGSFRLKGVEAPQPAFTARAPTN